MPTSTKPSNIDELWAVLQGELGAPGYLESYPSEDAVEAEVWARVRNLASHFGWNPDDTCLTSHFKRSPRSAEAWEKFRRQEQGADVEILLSKNRLDIVVKVQGIEGSIGIEVKLLGKKGHSGKFTQGLGQALLALENRTRTILVIHCGSISRTNADAARRLKQIGDKILKGSNTALVVVP
jgi:hypothetical protein